MKNSIRGASVAAFGAALLLALAACGDAAPKTGESQGTVTAIDASARTVTLDHEDIPGIMGAMTMAFPVAPEVSLEGVEPGAKVTFQVKHEGGTYTVTELRR